MYCTNNDDSSREKGVGNVLDYIPFINARLPIKGIQTETSTDLYLSNMIYPPLCYIISIDPQYNSFLIKSDGLITRFLIKSIPTRDILR